MNTTLLCYAIALAILDMYIEKIPNAPSYTLSQSMISDLKRFEMVIVGLIMIYTVVLISISGTATTTL